MSVGIDGIACDFPPVRTSVFGAAGGRACQTKRQALWRFGRSRQDHRTWQRDIAPCVGAPVDCPK
ncbi:hypothetical protein LHP98_16845 [Rhodobacter sp. Har01]|uniref:hypothetical protein n=1 Tax=Rhodobacter sp. Har01 TaxID=2883999 RepID=UPI001D0643CB|nr:hypothetical protein [Rhodobacter sp. Har01]MCB6179790.1 hypothetical protein [Rhodobacter sp. Har01]